MMDTVRGTIRVRAWPKPRPTRSAASLEREAWFLEANVLFKYIDPELQVIITDSVKNTPLYPRDIFLKLSSGRLGSYTDGERTYYSMSNVRDVSNSLDVIGQVPGDTLFRSPDRWDRVPSEGALDGYVYSWDATLAKPAWRVPATPPPDASSGIWWFWQQSGTVAALAQSQGNTVRPQRDVNVRNIFFQITRVAGATYNVGFAPFNTATGKITAAPTYVDTLVQGPVGGNAWMSGSYTVPKLLLAGTVYIFFFVRTDGAGNLSTEVQQQNQPISPPGFNPSSFGNGWTLASTAPLTTSVWTVRNNLVNVAFSFTFS